MDVETRIGTISTCFSDFLELYREECSRPSFWASFMFTLASGVLVFVALSWLWRVVESVIRNVFQEGTTTRGAGDQGPLDYTRLLLYLTVGISSELLPLVGELTDVVWT